MDGDTARCPQRGREPGRQRNPFLSVDVILMDPLRTGVFLVERRNPPRGWALPGGFVEYGEGLEEAARREAEEETSLTVAITAQFRAYGNPGRDPRFHTITVVFAGIGRGEPEGRDDARSVRFFRWDDLPAEMAFDHRNILDDYLRAR
jgi:ADP-ribose pyrophosphatase YjhB (NUDIX family)